MRILNMFAKAMDVFVVEWSAVAADLKAAAREMLDDNKRAAAHSKDKHPLGSSTPLPEALRRAQKSVARLEKKYQKTIQQAAVGMLAIDHAQALVEHLEKAAKQHHEAELRKAASGLYEGSRRFVDHLYRCGTSHWHFRQQSQREVEIYSDLVRWKAEDAKHENPSSPWLAILGIYDNRDLRPSFPDDPAPLSMPNKISAERALGTREAHPASTSAPARSQAHPLTVEAAPTPAPTPPIEHKKPTSTPTPALNGAVEIEPAPTRELGLASAAVPPPHRSDHAVGGSGGVSAGTVEAYAAVAASIVKTEKRWKSDLWREVGLPEGSTDYQQIARNAEAALAAGSTVPHLQDFAKEARKGYVHLFLRDLEQRRVSDLMKRLASDPDLRSSYAARGFNMPGSG